LIASQNIQDQNETLFNNKHKHVPIKKKKCHIDTAFKNVHLATCKYWL